MEIVRKTPILKITIENQAIKPVNTFTYLGTALSEEGKIDTRYNKANDSITYKAYTKKSVNK